MGVYCKFLEDYRRFSSGNETPELMHLWVGLATLAGACEKRLWIDQGYFRLYLNLYVILLAPAGVCAKSTSMDLGCKMLKEAGYTVMEGSITKEKIIEDMQDKMKSYTMPNGEVFPNTPVTFVSNELNVLLSSGADMVKFLVDIWDRDESYTYKTKNSGSFEIAYPYFNLLSAAVPQWFGGSVAKDMGSTGFLARCIIVYQDVKRGKYPRVVITPEQILQRDQCLQHLCKLSTKFGSIKLSTEADQAYYDWYMVQDPLPTDDYRICSYIERRTKVHTLKIAALMAIGDDRYTVEKIDFERAVDLLTITEGYMRQAYVAAGTNPHAGHIQHIINMLKSSNGQMKIEDVVRAVYTEVGAGDFKQILEAMEQMNKVVTVIEGKTRYLRLVAND